MLNLKKGLALVLAAATVFTFAPVAGLSTPVTADAAENEKSFDVEAGTYAISLTGDTETGATFTYNNGSAIATTGATVTVEKKGKITVKADTSKATKNGTAVIVLEKEETKSVPATNGSATATPASTTASGSAAATGSTITTKTFYKALTFTVIADINKVIDEYNSSVATGAQVETITKGALAGKKIVDPNSKTDIEKLLEDYNKTNTGDVITNGQVVVTEETVKVPTVKKSALKVASAKATLENGAKKSVKVTGVAGKVTVKSSNKKIASVTYKKGKVTIKANKPGTAIVTVTDAGKTSETKVVAGGQKVIVVTVKPIKKVSGVKVANKKGAKVKVSFKKVKGAKYQIKYTVKGKKAKTVTVKSTSKTIKVAKGKKVTVQVRAKKNGKYGAWSAKKSLKTDKK